MDSDALAHEAILKGAPIFNEIQNLFNGRAVLDESGISRKWLADIIFSDKEIKKKIEVLIHPYVFSRIAEEVGATDCKVVIVEVPLLYESGFENFCEQVIVVKTSEGKIKERLVKKGFSLSEIARRIQSQLSGEEKIHRAHYVIDNSEGLEKTRQEVARVWKAITNIKRS